MSDDRASEYMRGGKGRKDEVGGSGIYPASASDAPADAEIRTPAEFVGHKGPRAKEDQAVKESDQNPEGE